MTEIEKKIEAGRVELLRCKDQNEIVAKLKEIEADVGIEMGEVERYGMLLQSLLTEKFDGLGKDGNVQFDQGTFGTFCDMWLMAVWGKNGNT